MKNNLARIVFRKKNSKHHKHNKNVINLHVTHFCPDFFVAYCCGLFNYTVVIGQYQKYRTDEIVYF